MQIPQHIAGLSGRWSNATLKSAEGKGVEVKRPEREEHVTFSHDAHPSRKSQHEGEQVVKRNDDGASHAGEAGSYPEVAVCPECGSANCGCLARLEAQQKLDDLNAGRSPQKVNEISQAA